MFWDGPAQGDDEVYDAKFNEIMFLDGPAQGDDEVMVQSPMK